MSHIKGLLLAVVCATHFALIGGFLSASRTGQTPIGSHSTLRLQMVNTQQQAPQNHRLSTPAARPAPAMPTTEAIEPPLDVRKSDRTIDHTSWASEKSRIEALPLFNRYRFLDAVELDQPAEVSKAFEEALDKAVSSKFESFVLEFLIDENGQTVRLSCIEGDCSVALTEQLEQLLVIPFTPATKNGQPVASRKVIEVTPTPTFGL